MNDVTDTEFESQFNSTIQTIKRINELQQSANACALSNDPGSLHAWFKILRAMDREIMTYCSKEDIAEIEKVRKFNVPSDREARQPGTHYNFHNIEQKLDAYNRVLLSIMAKKGMGIIGKETDNVFFVPG